MRNGVKLAIAGALIGAFLFALPAAASAGVRSATHAQAVTCSRTLLADKAMTTGGVATCLGATGNTYTPNWCSSGPKGYLIDLKGREGLHGKVATVWAMRAGTKPYRAGANYSIQAVNAALCPGAGDASALLGPV